MLLATKWKQMLTPIHTTYEPLRSRVGHPIFSSPVSLKYGVEGPASIVRRPSSGVVCAEHNSHSIEVLKIISPYCINIFVMYVDCAQKKIVAPPIKLNSMRGQK